MEKTINKANEDKPKEFFTIIPVSLHRRLKGRAGLIGVSIQDMTTNALKHYLDVLDEEEENKKKEKNYLIAE